MVMQTIPIVPSDLNLLCLVVGGFVLLFGLCSLLVREKLYVAESTVAMAFGILLGNKVINLIDAHHWQHEALLSFILQASRLLIAVQVMIAGIELPGKYLKSQAVSLTVMLTILMLLKWLATALLFYWILRMPYLDALIVAACVAPTDPVLANSIVKGKYAERHVPENIRHILSAESGANDGLGYPFLFIALYLKSYPEPGSAVLAWFVNIVIWQVAVGIILGAVIGWAANRALHFAIQKDWIDKPSFLAFGVALAVFIVGFVGFLGSDDLLAAFVAGNSLTWDDYYRIEQMSEHIQSTVDELMTMSFFIFFGVVFPFDELATLYAWWQLLALAVTAMTLRRLPWLLLLHKWIPAIKSHREALFAGWFGPIGVSGLFYACLLHEVPETPDSIKKVVFPIVSLLVFASVVCHGMSIAFFKMGSTTANSFLEISRTISYTVRSTPFSRIPVPPRAPAGERPTSALSGESAGREANVRTPVSDSATAPGYGTSSSPTQRRYNADSDYAGGSPRMRRGTRSRQGSLGRHNSGSRSCSDSPLTKGSDDDGGKLRNGTSDDCIIDEASILAESLKQQQRSSGSPASQCQHKESNENGNEENDSAMASGPSHSPGLARRDSVSILIPDEGQQKQK